MLIESGCMTVLRSRGAPCEPALYHILLGNEPPNGLFPKNLVVPRLARDLYHQPGRCGFPPHRKTALAIRT